jgi:hypothetical protein
MYRGGHGGSIDRPWERSKKWPLGGVHLNGRCTGRDNCGILSLDARTEFFEI